MKWEGRERGEHLVRQSHMLCHTIYTRTTSTSPVNYLYLYHYHRTLDVSAAHALMSHEECNELMGGTEDRLMGTRVSP